MADTTETPTVTFRHLIPCFNLKLMLSQSMEAKTASLEKKLVELEVKNKATPLTEAALALNEVAEKKKADEATEMT